MLLSCDMLNALKEVSGKWSNARFDVTASQPWTDYMSQWWHILYRVHLSHGKKCRQK